MTFYPMPICLGCIHYRGIQAVASGTDAPDATTVETCDAYPAGIPQPIWLSAVDHRQPYDGDDGVVFAPKDAESATYAASLFALKAKYHGGTGTGDHDHDNEGAPTALAEDTAGSMLLYNPNHAPPGPRGGQFTSSGGGGDGGGPMSFNLHAHQERYGVDYHAHDTARQQQLGHTASGIPHWGKELAHVAYDAEAHEFRFSRPGTPQEDERGTTAEYHRMGLGWARFDAQTGAPRSHGQGMTAPTPEELKAWGAEAQHLASLWKGRTHELARDDLYIRYGNLPPNGRSKNYVTGQHEQGVSVYHAGYNVRSGMIEFKGGVRDEGTLMMMMGNREPHLVTGTPAGIGSDGEPIISNARVLHQLRYEPDAGAFAPANEGAPTA